MHRYLTLLNAVYLFWLGALSFTASGAADVLRWWDASALLAQLPVPDDAQLWLTRSWHFVAALCLLLPHTVRIGALLAALLYSANLLYLFTNPVWFEPLGGFPFIGSGQGVLKYVPMLATTLYLLGRRILAQRLAWIGILLVMCWIGAMKFFSFEAHGIEPLTRHHPVFSWMYSVWELQGVSNAIGVLEWAFALLVAASFRWPALRMPALAGIAVTVACTTSFMFTLPAWNSHFPLLNGSGVFLLKDQFLLAAMLMLWAAPKAAASANSKP